MAVLNVDYTVTKQADGVTDATKVPLQLPVPGAAANAWGAMMNDNFKSISTAFEYIGLQDLNITDGANGDVLVTDGSGNFSFTTLNLGANNIEDLNNVTTGSLSDQDFITYDNANSQWVNTTVADVKTRLNLHTVATSGDYNDLTNTPVNVSAFSNDANYVVASNNLNDLADANAARTNLGLATVAASGDYSDLSNLPVFSTVATSGDYNDLINTPVNVSAFSNDASYVVASNNLNDLADANAARTNLGLATVAASGDYSDLSNLPVFSTVATSGNYNDLSNLPDLSLKADLVAGKIPASQIPAIAVTEYMGVVADQTAMLALAGEKGDWCNRTDTGTMWIRTGTGNTIADWVEINYPADAVSSVNGQNGVVVLSAADVGALPSSTYIPQAGVDFDAPGTNNSTDVTLSSTYSYLSLTGQQITANAIDLASDVTGNLPYSSLSGAPYIPTSGTDFDPVGTDNSTDVTLSSTYSYLSLTGQQITANAVDLANDVTGNLPYSSLSGAPYIPQAGVDFDAPGTDNSTATSLDTTNHDYLSVSGTTVTLGPIDLTADVTNQLPASSVSGLATVATSNDYNDLTNLPTLTVVAQGDVTVPTATLAAGQFLAWDATNSVWTNASIGYGGQIVLHGTGAGAVSFTYTMDSLTDVTIDNSSLTNGQTLVYNGTTQQWENSNPVATGITRTVDTNNNAVIFSFA